VLFTGVKPLAREGVAVLEASARRMLGDTKKFGLLEEGFAGHDRFQHFERRS
jgi:hypothetical protein